MGHNFDYPLFHTLNSNSKLFSLKKNMAVEFVSIQYARIKQ